jgi:hypothetical protein
MIIIRRKKPISSPGGYPAEPGRILVFFFNGKLFQLEKSAPQRGVETLYLAFTAFFPGIFTHSSYSPLGKLTDE